MSRDLRAVLENFVSAHRSLRLGQLFGAPAGFAGRRVFAFMAGKDLQVRLPRSLREAKPSGLLSGGSREALRAPSGARPSVRHRRAASSDWITIRAASPAAAQLELLLEQSARYVVIA